MLTDDPSDEALFAGFVPATPSLEVSQRAVDSTRALLLKHVPSQQPRTFEPAVYVPRASLSARLAYIAVAASVLLALGVGVYSMTKQRRSDSIVANDPLEQIAGSTNAKKVPVEPDPFLDSAEKAIPIVFSHVAQSTPILVANGGKEPIALGSTTHKSGGVLHMWDWSKGVLSRVMPEVEFWGNEKVALSPDGKQLVWASGKILHLETGKWTTIELGREKIEVGGAIYNRIGKIRFSPDGRHLTVFVTNFWPNMPGRIESEVVQVMEFPTGKILCELPWGEQVCFSADGQHIVSATFDSDVPSQRRISLRDAATGNVQRSFDPALPSQVMGLAISPDSKHIAASQRQRGDLLIWETDTGRLAQRVDGEELKKQGGHDPGYGTMCFSPDAKLLAAAYWGRVFVIDVATGKTLAALKEDMGTNIQWSADGKELTVITAVSIGKRTKTGRENRYPSVHKWDWQNNQRIE
jgi:WD40 repeat protein